MRRQDTALRSDAQRNRERILDVAMTELSRAADTPLSVIAKKAGVGQATFYRNFPDRKALVLELYHHEMQQLAESVTELLESREPLQAFREWMDRFAQCAMTRAGLADAINPAKPRSPLVIESMERLLRANEEAGTIRPGVTADDFILAIAGLFQIDPSGDWPSKVARLLDLVMDGLRAGAPRETKARPRRQRVSPG